MRTVIGELLSDGHITKRQGSGEIKFRGMNGFIRTVMNVCPRCFKNKVRTGFPHDSASKITPIYSVFDCALFENMV